MDKFNQLKDVVDDYVLHMEGINEKRLELLEKEVELSMQEVKLFNLFMHNLTFFQEISLDAVS